MSTPEPNTPTTAEPTDKTEEARRIWVVTKMGVLGIYRSQIPRMAAALAYRTIFSIIPVMAIGLLIFGSVVSDEQVESGVRRVLTFAGISQISMVDAEGVEPGEGVPGDDKPVIETGDEAGDELADEVTNEVQEAAPEIAEDIAQEAIIEGSNEQAIVEPIQSQEEFFADADLEQMITDLITRVNQSIRDVPTGWIALTSGLVLFYAAMSMLIEIEKSFNQLCGAHGGRSWLRRLMLYWTILTAGSLMLAATFLAGDAFTKLVISVAGEDSMIGAVMAGYGVSVLISTVMLLGAYLIIPNTRVAFRPALAGAFLAAVLWELGKLGFTTYLRHNTRYSELYGSIAILPLFMLWVYLTWLIVLLGMQASFTLANFSELVESKLRKLNGSNSDDPVLIDPLVMLSIARAVQGSFVDGTPCTAESVASKARLDQRQATKLLDALTRAGLTNRVYEGESLRGWTPARPAEQIKLDEILEAAYGVDGFRQSGAGEQLPVSIRQAAMAACKELTLKDLQGEKPA
tara:strand:- start:95475 stop:97025 length:1551 start_codon:yes stop_codon:yes gene_type:complete